MTKQRWKVTTPGNHTPGHCPPRCSQVSSFPPTLPRIPEPSIASPALAESQVWIGLAPAYGGTKQLSHHKTAVSSPSSGPAFSRSRLGSGWVETPRVGGGLRSWVRARACPSAAEISRREPYDYCLSGLPASKITVCIAVLGRKSSFLLT